MSKDIVNVDSVKEQIGAIFRSPKLWPCLKNYNKLHERINCLSSFISKYLDYYNSESRSLILYNFMVHILVGVYLFFSCFELKKKMRSHRMKCQAGLLGKSKGFTETL